MSTTPPEVFLSHATADKEHVDLVRGQLEALGLRVYLAEHDPHPGRLLGDKVNEAMQRAALVVVLITSTSTDSHYVQQEIGAAVALGKPIMPVVDSRIAGTIDLGMLAGTEYLVLDPAQPAEAMKRITASLRGLSTPPAPMPIPASPIFSDAEKLILLGAVVLLALLILSEGGGGPPVA
jgi:hypothetical protein